MALSIGCLKPIFPKYDYKYTNSAKEACSTYLSDKNPFNLLPASGEYKKEGSEQVRQCQEGILTTKVIDWKGKSRGLFFHHPPGNVNVISVKLSEDCKGPVPVTCRERTKTRCTQTRYRESSAQTRPYQPEISGDKENYKNLEIYEISKLIDSYGPPGEYEVKVIERARRRLQYESALQLTVNDKEKHRMILEAMEWEEWVAREEDIHSCQMLRMEIVLEMFKEREQKLHIMSDKRIVCSTERIQAKRASQLKQINADFGRGMRRLEAKKQQITRSYRKANITQEHIDPASDLHAPQMRFGVNPNRRHFVGFRKNFDDRIGNLEKQKDERGLSSLICPFSKLRSWAKPKQRMKEVTQRFCSDENLKNLYENLKSLRTVSVAPKRNPKCLKRKIKSVELDANIRPKGSVYKIEPDRPRIEREEISSIIEETQELPLTNDELTESLRQRRARDLLTKTYDDISNILGVFEGTTLGKLMQFLNNELERLMQQKKFKAIHMLAERERWRRESFEAGLRQKENNLRENYDEQFRTACNVHRDTATLFLESVLEEEFDFTAEALATKKVIDSAIRMDNQDLNCIKKHGHEKEIIAICEQMKQQLFTVVENRFAKMNDDMVEKAKLNAMKKQLFASVEEALATNYRTPDTISVVGEFLDEMFTGSVHYDFGVLTPCPSEDEFNIENEIDEVINKLLKLVVAKPHKKDIFTDSTDFQMHLVAEREARAIVRKLIRMVIPERPWKNDSERVVEGTLSTIFNDTVYEVECLKTARIVSADDKLKEIISEIYLRIGKYPEQYETPSSADSSTGSTLSACIKSIYSTMDIFVNHQDYIMTESSGNVTEEEYIQSVEYLRENFPPLIEPAEIGRHHERFNIMRSIAKRFHASQTVSEHPFSTESDLSDETSEEVKYVFYLQDNKQENMIRKLSKIQAKRKRSSSLIRLSSSDSSRPDARKRRSSR